MTGTDGAITFPFETRARRGDDAVPDLLVTLDAEYFVDWQVADIAPLADVAGTREQ